MYNTSIIRVKNHIKAKKIYAIFLFTPLNILNSYHTSFIISLFYENFGLSFILQRCQQNKLTSTILKQMMRLFMSLHLRYRHLILGGYTS